MTYAVRMESCIFRVPSSAVEENKSEHNWKNNKRANWKRPWCCAARCEEQKLSRKRKCKISLFLLHVLLRWLLEDGGWDGDSWWSWFESIWENNFQEIMRKEWERSSEAFCVSSLSSTMPPPMMISDAWGQPRRLLQHHWTEPKSNQFWNRITIVGVGIISDRGSVTPKITANDIASNWRFPSRRKYFYLYFQVRKRGKSKLYSRGIAISVQSEWFTNCKL